MKTRKMKVKELIVKYGNQLYQGWPVYPTDGLADLLRSMRKHCKELEFQAWQYRQGGDKYRVAIHETAAHLHEDVCTLGKDHDLAPVKKYLDEIKNLNMRLEFLNPVMSWDWKKANNFPDLAPMTMKFVATVHSFEKCGLPIDTVIEFDYLPAETFVRGMLGDSTEKGRYFVLRWIHDLPKDASCFIVPETGESLVKAMKRTVPYKITKQGDTEGYFLRKELAEEYK